jgi:hypothetical protein
MKLYATVTSERDSRAGKKGGNEFVQIELSAFGRPIGSVVLETTDDALGEPAQFLLKFAARKDCPVWVILNAGHKNEGVIQTIKA